MGCVESHENTVLCRGHMKDGRKCHFHAKYNGYCGHHRKEKGETHGDHLSSRIRRDVWIANLGLSKVGKCYCCQKEINDGEFECAHIKARQEGGCDAVWNLKPTCSGCNREMGTKNLFHFVKTRYPDHYRQVDHREWISRDTAHIYVPELIGKPE